MTWILGLFVALVGLGAWFSIDLVLYGYWILLLSAGALFMGVPDKKSWMITGTAGVALFVGIQSPQLVWPWAIVVVGIGLMLPQLYEQWK